MAEKIDILQVVNSHLTLHLLAPGEADIPHGNADEAGDTGESGDAAGANAACGADQQEGTAFNGAEPQPADEFLPENLVEDFVDEISDMLEAEKSRYAKYQRWERPLIIGFLDGVLAVANDTWSELEDLYP